MKSIRGVTLMAATGILLAACGGEAPSSPQVSTLFTQLHVQPLARMTEIDPRGLITLSVTPAEIGGTVTIEVCSDQAGQPMPGSFAIDTADCGAANGQWRVARDSEGRLWDRVEVTRSISVHFDGEAGPAGLLFRSSYRAPNGGYGEDIGACPWVLAENLEVGVVCTSDDEVRLLP
jgi:hypothetical protein